MGGLFSSTKTQSEGVKKTQSKGNSIEPVATMDATGKSDKQLKRRLERIDKKNKKTSTVKTKRPPSVPCNIHICIDLGFDDYMTQKESHSTMKQLGFAYGALKAPKISLGLLPSNETSSPSKEEDSISKEAIHPSKDSISKDSPSKEEDDEKMEIDGPNHVFAGLTEWKRCHLYIARMSDSFREKFTIQCFGHVHWSFTTHIKSLNDPSIASMNVVYLTADSPNTLHTLDENSVYIVGGIVDRNRHKNLCLKVAQEHGLCTARLPIGEYMNLKSRHVLTINQVVDILGRVVNGSDWKDAFFAAIPSRKGGSELSPGS